MNINGDYYAIPYNNNINMVFFNKKMFDEAGVEYPKEGWTWEDFRNTAIIFDYFVILSIPFVILLLDFKNNFCLTNKKNIFEH